MDFYMRLTESEFRALTPLQQFLANINVFVNFILETVRYYVISPMRSNPILLWGFGFFALLFAVGILKRFLSRS